MNAQEVQAAIEKASALVNDSRFNAIAEHTRNGQKLSESQINAYIAKDSNHQRMPNNFVDVPTNGIMEAYEKRGPIIDESMVTPNVISSYASMPQQQVSAGIDYSLIKNIVNDCVRENLKELLGDGGLKGFRFSSGNKLQFVDNKGNIFEGTLTLKKKAKD